MPSATPNASPLLSAAWPWLAIWCLALGVRAAYFWQVRDSDLATILMGDASVYDAWAQRIAAGDWLGDKVFYQAPLYPYFLAIIYALGGHHLLLVRLVQIVLGACSCVFLGKASEHMISRRAGYVAGGLMALCPTVIFFDCLIQKAVLDVFIFSLTWMLAAIAAQRQGGGGWWLSLGVAIGLLALTRENALVVLPLFLVWAWQHARWRAAAAMIAGVMLVLLPVAVRNRVVGGEFHLTTSQMGPNFYIGNNEHADGTYIPLLPRRGDPAFEQTDANDLAERALHRKLSTGEVSAFWMDKSLAFIREHPWRWAGLMGRKWLLVWNAAELGDTEEQSAYAAHSPVLRWLSAILHFGVLCPLAVAGLVWSWRRRREVWILAAVALTYALSVAAFYVFARYRLPLYLIVIVFAAASLAELRDRVRWPISPSTWRGIVGCTLMAVFVNWPLSWHDKVDGTVTLQNLGLHMVKTRQYERAIAYFDQVLERVPESAEAYAGKGLALSETHQFDEALTHLETALRLNPEFPSADNNLGTVFMAKGRPAEALAHFEKALNLRPEEAAIHYNLGNACLQLDRRFEAIAHYETALQLQSDFADAHNNLGSLRFQMGNTEEAVEHFRKYAELCPNAAGAHANLGVALRQLGHTTEAIQEYGRALAIDPNQAAALGNLAWILATSMDATLRDDARALQLASMADEITQHRSAGVRRILAAALAEKGNFIDAESTADSAINIAESQGEHAFAEVIVKERACYRARQPFREAR